MALRLAGVVLETAPELGLGTMEHAAPREPSVLGTAPSSAFEHAGPRESSADELGVAGAQPLPPSPMPSLTLAQHHWTDEHASPEAEAAHARAVLGDARAVLGDAQGYAGGSPPQPTHHGLQPIYPDSQQALSSPAVQTYYAQQAYKQQAYSQQALYPPPEPPPAEVPAPCWAPNTAQRATAASDPRRRRPEHHPDEPLPRPTQRSAAGSYALTTARGLTTGGAPTAAGGVGGMLPSDENLDANLDANLGELLSVEPLSRPLSRMALDTAPARVRPSTAGATGGAAGAAGGAGGAGGARSGTGGHAFTGRVHRGNPFRKAADLWAPARCAHPCDPGWRPHGALQIEGDHGRSWEIVGALQIAGGAGGGRSA